jgi:peptidoglycan/xylan/chitin deacetylase (PgdA/CDA1 family)
VSVAIVMYHYVRPIAGSQWPGIRGREVTEFAGQLAWLRRSRTLVGMEDVVAAWTAGAPLPDDAAVLTFDDGLRDHHAHVLPLLADAGVRAAFFPPSGPLAEPRVLDVHRIQFVLAAGADPEVLATELDARVAARGLGDVAALRERFAHPSRWDPAGTVYVKRVLQRGLPAAARRELTGDLFARFVTTDEAAFAAELYCGPAELRELVEAGMHLGSHTHTHGWLTDLDADSVRDELARSLAPLRDAGVDTAAGWTLSYPYGGHDDTTVAVARELGCTAAVTIEVREAVPGLDDALRLPRLNTNDLPLRP